MNGILNFICCKSILVNAHPEFVHISDVQPPLILLGNPSNNSSVHAGDSIEFTCLLDAYPVPRYSIWIYSGSGSVQKWSDMDRGKNSIILNLERQHNGLGVFCRAEGNLDVFPLPLNSTQIAYTVQCGYLLSPACGRRLCSGDYKMQNYPCYLCMIFAFSYVTNLTMAICPSSCQVKHFGHSFAFQSPPHPGTQKTHMAEHNFITHS